MALQEICNTTTNYPNISRVNASSPSVLIKGFLVFPDVTTQLAFADIDKAAIKLLIQEGKAFYFPRIIAATDSSPDVATNVTGYGVSQFGSFARNISVLFDIDTSNCMMANLEKWSDVNVGVYPIYEDDSFGGVANGDYLKVQTSKFGFVGAKIKVEKDTKTNPTMIWLADNYQINTVVKTDYLLGLDGIIDCTATIGTVSTSVIELIVKESFNGIGIAGLAFGDFSVTLANGTVVAPTAITDNSGGSYSLTVATTTGANFIDFSLVSIALVGSDKLVGLALTPVTTP